MIYCASCYRGSGGSLITNDEADLLRIRRDADPSADVDGMGVVLGDVRAIVDAALSQLASIVR